MQTDTETETLHTLFALDPEADLTVIDAYTGTWQSALRPSAPSGYVAYSASPDGRELDDFARVLRTAGLTEDFIEHVEGWDLYAITPRASDPT